MVLVCLPSDALSQHLPSYLGSLTSDVRYLFTAASAKLLLLTLDEGYLLTATPPDLERGVAALGPPAPAQPPLLGGGVAPLGRRPWPRTWGSSSWPPLLRCRSLVLSVATPNLGRGVAPHGHASVRSVAAGALLHILCSKQPTDFFLFDLYNYAML